MRPATATGRALRDDLQKLHAERPQRDVFIARAVELIGGVSGISCAALLGYQQRPEGFHVLGSTGLETDALKILEGAATAGGWDIPLRSVRNRRINVIESAHENPFVPPALIEISPRRLTIAVMPFFHGQNPVGVAVLFAPTQRGFADTLLQSLNQALRVCGAALSDLPSAESEKKPSLEQEPERPQANLLRGLAALRAELTRLGEALEEKERQRAAEAAERVTAQSFLQAEQQHRQRLQQEIEALREQQTRLPVLEGQVAGLTERLQELTNASDAAAARLRDLEETLLGAEAQTQQSESTISDLTTARQDLDQQLATALESAKQRAETAGGLEKELKVRTSEINQLQKAVLAAQEEGAATAAELSRAQDSIAAAEGDRDRVTQALDESHSALARSEAEQSSLADQLATLRTRFEALQAGQEDTARASEQLAGAEAARKALADEIEALRIQFATETRANEKKTDELREQIASDETTRISLTKELEALSAERTDLTALLEESDRDSKKLQQEREEALSRIAALEKDLQSTRDVLLADVNARLEAATQSLEETQSTLAAERQGRTVDIAALNGQLLQQQTEFSEDLSALREETDSLRQALAEKDLLLQSAEDGLTGLDMAGQEEGADEEPLAIDRSYSGDAATAADASGDEDDEGASVGEVVLLESGEWAAETVRQLHEFGHRVVSRAPRPDATSDLAGRPLACTAINLAEDSSWSTLRYIRNGSGISHAPMFAYALAPNSARGFWLGSVDFVLLPVADVNLGDILRRMVPRIRRAIAMSTDIDVVSSVREKLGEVGISTAVVLDGRQALDLVATVRPEAAVLHLSPNCTDVFRTIAGLRGAEATRDIPLLFLLDHEALDREEAFLSTGIRTLSARGNLVPGGLTSQLVSALDPYRPA